LFGLNFPQSAWRVGKNQPVKLGVDCAYDDTIPALILNYAAQANWIRIVLFSSKSALRLNREVKAVREPAISLAQVALFGQLVE
jgi:hypothetical protein